MISPGRRADRVASAWTFLLTAVVLIGLVGPNTIALVENAPASAGIFVLDSTASKTGSSIVSSVRVTALPSAAPAPSVGGSVLGFQNSTESPIAPPASQFGSLAWDPALNEAVFFGGSNGSSISGETWLFQGGRWSEDVSAGGPSPRVGAAMAYDAEPGIDAVVLFGGCNPFGSCPLNDTWTFAGGTWENRTPDAGPMPGLYNASMTSWGANGTVLFGGCASTGCSSQSSSTWVFENGTACQSVYHGPCWTPVATVGSHPPGLAAVGLAEDPFAGQFGSIVLYGGWNRTCPSCAATYANSTWLYNGLAWDNVTSLLGSGPDYPNVGRALPAFFWDPVTQDLYLYGGVDSGSGLALDELWELDLNDSSWFNESSLTLPTQPLYGPAVAGGLSASPAWPALLVGGSPSAGSPANRTYVFERGILSTIHLTPDPVATNATVFLYSNTTGGIRPSGTWSMGDGSVVVGGNTTYSYRSAGGYQVTFTATDIYGVEGSARTSVSVTLLDTGFVPPAAVDQGTATPFSATPTNGTPPYNLTWTFSDGGVAYGPSILHTFATTGPASVEVSVRDASGTVVNESAALEVNPPLTATVLASWSTLTLGTTTNLTITGHGGSPPYRASWSLPNNHSYVGPEVSYRPAAPGAEIAFVSLTDLAGAFWNGTVPLTVNPSLTFTARAASSGPTAGRTVSFSTSISGGTSPFSYGWQFGDGASSTAATPTHTYANAGTFTVFVWVNDSGGATYRQTLEVQVSHTSGGLLWEVFDLPLYEQLAIWGVVAVAIALVAAAAYRRARRGQAPPSGGTHSPSPSPPGPGSPK